MVPAELPFSVLWPRRANYGVSAGKKAHGLPFPGRLGPQVSQGKVQKTSPFCHPGTAEKS